MCAAVALQCGDTRYGSLVPPSGKRNRPALRAGPKCPECGWTTCRGLVKANEPRKAQPAQPAKPAKPAKAAQPAQPAIPAARLLVDEEGRTYARTGDFVALAAEAVLRGDAAGAVRHLKAADAAVALLPARDDTARTYVGLAKLVSEAAQHDLPRCDSVPLLRLRLALRARPVTAAAFAREAVDTAGAAVDIGDYVAAGADFACEALAAAREAAPPAGLKKTELYPTTPAPGAVFRDTKAVAVAVATAARDRRAPALYREALAACDFSEALGLATAAAEDGIPWGVKEAAERLRSWSAAINLKAIRAGFVRAMTDAASMGYVSATLALAGEAADYISRAPPASRTSVVVKTNIGKMSEAERWRQEDVAECMALVNRVIAGGAPRFAA